MAIFKNIPPVGKILISLRHIQAFKGRLDRAVAQKDFNRERELLHVLMKTWGTSLMDTFNVDLKVYGKENYPIKGPVVYVCNHQSFVDIPVLCAAVENLAFGFVARDNLRKMPFLGPWMDKIHCVLMSRDNPKEALKSIQRGVSEIKKGYSLLIFPEGTRALGGDMREFKPGALKLATKPKVPIVPISLNGSYDMYEKTGVFHGSPVRVKVHPPIETANLTKEEEKELPDKVFKIVKDGLYELKEEMGQLEEMKEATEARERATTAK